MHWSSQLLSLFEQTHTPYALGCTMYLQHALLLLLPPFLTLSLLIRVPRPAVTLPGLGQHREWHLPDPTTHPHTHTHKYWRTRSQSKQNNHHLQTATVSSGVRKTPIYPHGHPRHTYAKTTAPTFTTGKEEEKGKNRNSWSTTRALLQC